jgi:transcriptional regulator with XRE-family HTH domain
MTKRRLAIINVHVGRRIRMRRKALQLSQAALGEAIGVSFQQIQKYEKGSNGVGSQRLQAMAAALQVSIKFFFEATPGSERVPECVAPDFIDEFLADRRGIELARQFVKITDMAARDAMLMLAKAFAQRAPAAEL